MEKINIVEILKNCPKGMELDCTMFDDVTLLEVIDRPNNQFPIKIAIGANRFRCLTETGGYDLIPETKCVIFPKGKTTWEGFVPPCKFKDGDIVATSRGAWIGITTGGEEGELMPTYCVIKDNGTFEAYLDVKKAWCFSRFATKEERQKLFDEIKAHGYTWNSKTKTLEEITQPNFKVGDWVTDGVSKCQIHSIDDTQYWYSENCILGSIESVDKRYHLWTINDAKDGDVIFYDSGWTCIFKNIHGIWYSSYCFITDDGEFHTGYKRHAIDATINGNAHPATKEQCDLLFSKMKEMGYKWVAETKTLEKLPKFKVGSKVRHKTDKTVITITGIKDNYYFIQFYNIRRNDYQNEKVSFADQDNYELVSNKFDITTLKPFDKVLVRQNITGKWGIDFFGSYNEGYYHATGGCAYRYCIPYEGNEHLRDTRKDCDEYYKVWE